MSASPLQKRPGCRRTGPRAPEVIQSMSACNRRRLEDTATGAPRGLDYLGTDGAGAVHYWSFVDRKIVVDEHDGTSETYYLDELPIDTLSEWVDHVEDKRGAWAETRVGGSLVDDLGELLGDR